MLIGAADTSDNRNHLSVIIGTVETIRGIHNAIGFRKIHMRDMTSDEKDLVIKNFVIKGDIHAVCFHMNRTDIVTRVHSQLRKRKGKKFVEMQFSYALITKIRGVCLPFLVKHKRVLEAVTFQCDSDMRTTFTHLGFQWCFPDVAHELTDVIAYCNSQNRKLDDKITEIDLADKLEHECRKRCGI